MSPVTTVILIALAIILFIIIVRNIKVVPQAHAVVVERLGAYKATWGTMNTLHGSGGLWRYFP